MTFAATLAGKTGMRIQVLVALVSSALVTLGCGEKAQNGAPNVGGGPNNDTNNPTNNGANNPTNNPTNNGPNNPTNNGSNNTANNTPSPDEDRSCDSLNDGHCMFPFPSMVFLAPDDARETGYQLEFPADGTPINRGDKRVEPDNYRRFDGYGLQAPAMAIFPGIDASGFPNEYNVGASMDDDAPIGLFQIAGETATRIPYFVDYDRQATDPDRRSVIVRPAILLEPGTRYAVAFRNLVNESGDPIAPGAQFQKLLDGNTDDDANLFYRQARFDELFSALEGAGFAKSELTLAWDWVTSSTASRTGMLLHMRDEALTASPTGPELTITNVEEFTVAENADTAVRISGTFEVPNYLAQTGSLKHLNLGDDGMPEQNGTRNPEFWINIPHSALNGPAHGLVMYGHGLFGSGSRANADFNSRIANANDLIFYGADLWGMSYVQEEQDAFAIIGDLTNFPSIGDQLHQGFLEWVLLARAMKERFGSLTEVTDRSITVNNDEMFYSGISQGGIMGTTFVAISPDVHVGHAGVPGHTYSTLLHRSVDFEQFFQVLRGTYEDPVDQLLGLHMIQLLWDQTDSVSYFRHLSQDPFDGVTKQMLYAPAKGDFQVAVIQNEILARTPGLGISVMQNYDPRGGRTVDLATEATYPHTGSAVVLYDFVDQPDGAMMTWSNEWPLPGNAPPEYGDQGMCDAACPVGENVERARFGCCSGACCFDAHELPRRRDWHNDQMVHFFRNGGEVIDVCGGDGCTPD